jgi:hypothetical protein
MDGKSIAKQVYGKAIELKKLRTENLVVSVPREGAISKFSGP